MSAFTSRRQFWEAVLSNNLTLLNRLLNYDALLANDRKGPNDATALMVAVSRGYFQIAIALLGKRADVDALGKYGQSERVYSPLLIAAELGNIGMINLLLLNQVDINQPDPDGYTALMVSILHNQVNCAAHLINNGADVNLTALDGNTALIFASGQGVNVLLPMLLTFNANISHRNNKGYTPLTVAVNNNNLNCVNFLLANGSPDVDACIDSKGNTTLMNAAVHYDTVMFNMLLARSNDINHRNTEGNTALIQASMLGHINCVRSLCGRNADLTIANNNGYRVLALAAASGQREVLEFLLNLTNNNGIDQRTPDGESVLMTTSASDASTASDCVKLLLERGADPNVKSDDGNTALMYAAVGGKPEILNLLLEANANINERNNNGKTALMFASENGRRLCVEALKDRDATQNLTDNEGNNALNYAAMEGHKSVVEYLLDNRMFINHLNNDGLTSMMLASQNGHVECVELLLSRGAPRDANNRQGVPAIVLAAQNGHTAVVSLLLSKGVDVNTRLRNKNTILMVASDGGHCDLVNHLIRRGANPWLQNSNNLTAKKLALNNNRTDVVRILQEAQETPRSLASSSALAVLSRLPNPTPASVWNSLRGRVPDKVIKELKLEELRKN